MDSKVDSKPFGSEDSHTGLLSISRSKCIRISANIDEFFAEVATDAESAMLDALGRRNIADSLAALLRFDAIRMKRGTITANPDE
jgi:hypothetical protein